MKPVSVERPLRNPGLLLAWLTIAWALTWLTVTSLDVGNTDFHAFYRHALLARGGQPDPSSGAMVPDLNTPVFASLLAPLTFLPLRPAFLVWTALGAIALVSTLYRLHAHRGISIERLAWFAGACGILAPGRMIWSEGQVSWILLFLITRAWLLAEAGTAASGVWLGLAVAIKPPLALIALLLPWRIGVSAAITSALAAGTHVALTGWAPWSNWIGDVSGVNWLATPTNASLWGLVARLQTGSAWIPVSLGELRLEWIMAAVLIAAGLAWQVRQRTTCDRRWALAILWSVLISPLGWIHYLPLTLGPLAAIWRPRWVFRVSATLFVFPIAFVSVLGLEYLNSGIVGSVSVFTVMVAWIVISRDASARR